MTDYFDRKDHLNWSSLKRMRNGAKCDALAAMRGNFNEDSEAMKLGRAFHELVLQGEVKEFQVKPGCKTTTLPGFITETQMEHVSYWAKAARDACTKFGIFWETDQTEKELFWEFGGVKCKAKLDAFSIPRKTIIDFKTTTVVDPQAFKWDLFDYAGQLAWYKTGMENLSVVEGVSWGGEIVAVQKSYPNKVFVYRFSPETLANIQSEVVGPLFNRYIHEGEDTAFLRRVLLDRDGLLIGDGDLV